MSQVESREFRVFISSTFRDMHDERDMLNQKVFPEIRKICWERGVNFSPVDLRWGINSKESERDDVLRICLDEVESSQPFFIGILGQRYGWIPNQSQSGLNKDDQINLYDGVVLEGLLKERSVTEMEIRYGMTIIKNIKKSAAFFYFKKESSSDNHEIEPFKNKLDQLKNYIRNWLKKTNNTGNLLDGYVSLDELGEQIRSDLLKVINSRWPENENPSSLECEQARHLGFAQSRRQDYIVDEASISWIDRHLDSLANIDDRRLVIWGPTGIGKSALLAEWVNRTSIRRPDVFIFEHYINANSQFSSSSVFAHLLDKMNAPKHEVEHAQQSEKVEEYILDWFIKYKNPIVLVFDFNGGWFKFFDNLPDNVLLITTKRNSSKGVALEVLPLNDERRAKLIDNFSKRYRKYLDDFQVSCINASQETRNPLFLKTVLDELRVFGRVKASTAEGVSSEITVLLKSYLNSKSLLELFDKIISYRENALGYELVKNILSLIRLSLVGLTENELYSLLLLQGKNYTQRDVIEVLRLFDSQLSYSGADGGVYHFIYDAMDDAVWNRYSFNTVMGARLEWHILLANYFYNRPDRFLSARLRESIPFYLIESGQIEKLDKYSSEVYMSQPPVNYIDCGYLIGGLRRINNISNSRFLASVRDSISIIMANWNQDNNDETIIELNRQLYFSNKIDPDDGGLDLLESLAIIVKEKGLGSYASYIQTVLSETSTVFYFYSTIDRILSYLPDTK